MKKHLIRGLAFVGALLAFMAAAAAQTTATSTTPTFPTKAPAYTLPTYPALNGFIFGVFTEGGGASVNASAPGVPAASLTTTTAGIGATFGYMWTPRNSPLSISLEGDIEAQNFNGNNAGFSVSGPLALEQRAMLFTSAANVQTLFTAIPNIPNIFAQISPFTIPNGFVGTGKNLMGIGVLVREADVSQAFQGVQAGKVWRENLGIVAMAVQPTTNGGAFREYVKFDFGTGSTLFGAVPKGNVQSVVGPGARAGVGYAF